MAAFRSFEYGRDISLLKSALRFAERILHQEDASQTLFSLDHSHSKTAAVTVSNRIQNAGSAGIELAVTSSRLHTAIFVNVLLANDIVGEAELEYFESVLDDFPRIGWHFYAELVSTCGWREYFIQNLKALSPRIRLRVLEAVHDISKTLPYVWSCIVSALTWSLCISPIKGISVTQDEILSALSNLQALPSSNEASPTEECLLEDSVQFLVQLSGNCSLSDMKMAASYLGFIFCCLAALIIWVISHESLLTHQWICDILNDHLKLLSHPELFRRLCQAALCSDANTCIKKLVLKMCSGSPPKLQEAMLFYVFSSKSFKDDSLPLKLADFESLLTEKLNLISDADLRMDSEDKAQVLSEFASLCMQSPSEVIEAVVDMAVTDGCTTAVAQLLIHLRVVCHFKQQWCDTGQDLLGSIALGTFQRLCSETSRHQDNFTCLIKELVEHSDVLNCDWFLVQIIYCIDLVGAGDRYNDSFFPLQVIMAIAPKISMHYIVPVARILVQMLDKACIELNGARKQKVLHFLHAYLSLDRCTSQTDVLCGSNLSHAAVKCLLKKKCIVHEAFGVPIEQEELVLLDAKKWRNSCQKVASQFPECSLTELLMPHFCLWLAGATSEEWEILSAQLRRALNIDAGHSVSAAVFIQELVMCLIGCKSYVAVGNWSYLFTCFANTVMECLKMTKELSEEDLHEILLALIFALSSLPSRCLRQELLLLVDVSQWMKTSVLGEELATLFREALATQCYQSDFVSGLVKTSVHKLLAHKANQS
ncbi:uncharacterized protein [Dermacentor albipictus]|uniref:uncharacterized protein isoform X3 n=1 Tax=Dermacentor albipictus TaxID=60249 RepID=UPI0031FD0864